MFTDRDFLILLKIENGNIKNFFDTLDLDKIPYDIIHILTLIRDKVDANEYNEFVKSLI